MVIWVLVEEPTEAVERVIEICEARLDSESEVTWLVPGPVVEPVQE